MAGHDSEVLKEVGLDIIRRNMRTANMTGKESLSTQSRL